MVAKISLPKQLEGVLRYNENKVNQGKADCLLASGFLSDAEALTFAQKLRYFQNLQERNDRAQIKTLHLSLNFDPSEKLSKERLLLIAEAYMHRIGFGGQPYLVYQHFDAGHPHLHIVSSLIREDGSRISTHNIGRDRSEKARQELEIKFGLLKAGGRGSSGLEKTPPLAAHKLIYGKGATKKGITNVVNAVVQTYCFTSLPEFNAVLQQFNVLADRGSEEGKIYKNRGLLYRVLDEGGKKVGVPVKASVINSRPTLAKLEGLFAQNSLRKKGYQQALRSRIDEVLNLKPCSLREFMTALQEKEIYTLLRQNDEGKIYGITFVDNKTRSVFNGSDLGKPYSISGLQRQLAENEKTILPDAKNNAAHPTPYLHSPLGREPIEQGPVRDQSISENEILSALLHTEKREEGASSLLLKKKRKERKHSRPL